MSKGGRKNYLTWVKTTEIPIWCARIIITYPPGGAQWLSCRVLASRPKGRRFEPHPRHCLVSLSKNINPSLVLVQTRKTRPFRTERLLMGPKQSNLTKQNLPSSCHIHNLRLIENSLYGVVILCIFLGKLHNFQSLCERE